MDYELIKTLKRMDNGLLYPFYEDLRQRRAAADQEIKELILASADALKLSEEAADREIASLKMKLMEAIRIQSAMTEVGMIIN